MLVWTSGRHRIHHAIADAEVVLLGVPSSGRHHLDLRERKGEGGGGRAGEDGVVAASMEERPMAAPTRNPNPMEDREREEACKRCDEGGVDGS